MDVDQDNDLDQTLELAREVLERLSALASSGAAEGVFALRLARAHALALLDELNELAGEAAGALGDAAGMAASPRGRQG